jgi:peptidase E
MSDSTDFSTDDDHDDTGRLYLLADSQLLFWRRRDKLLLETVRETLAGENPLAVYIGASNGDQKEFYAIFEAATQAAGFSEPRMISSTFNDEDRESLERAQLILLAGGDVHLGWSTFEKTGMKDRILARFTDGAVLVGVSAGAVQMGRHAIVDKGESAVLELVDMLNLVPAIIDVHDEEREWTRLSNTVRMLEGSSAGLGIPAGAGIVFHADGAAEPLRRPVHEFSCVGGLVEHTLLFPADED